MLRKRYLTIHETSEAKARAMSILGSFSTRESCLDRTTTHRVVAFIVKVRLVEKRAKRKVGSVMVVNVINQTRVPGTALAMTKRPCPNSPIHV